MKMCCHGGAGSRGKKAIKKKKRNHTTKRQKGRNGGRCLLAKSGAGKGRTRRVRKNSLSSGPAERPSFFATLFFLDGMILEKKHKNLFGDWAAGYIQSQKRRQRKGRGVSQQIALLCACAGQSRRRGLDMCLGAHARAPFAARSKAPKRDTAPPRVFRFSFFSGLCPTAPRHPRAHSTARPSLTRLKPGANAN